MGVTYIYLDKCTNDTCDPMGGCIFTTIEYNPQPDKCTNVLCDPVVGFTSSVQVCRPSDRCSCDPNVGCTCRDTN